MNTCKDCAFYGNAMYFNTDICCFCEFPPVNRVFGQSLLERAGVVYNDDHKGRFIITPEMLRQLPELSKLAGRMYITCVVVSGGICIDFHTLKVSPD